MEIVVFILIIYGLRQIIDNTSPTQNNNVEHTHGKWTHVHPDSGLHYHPNGDINEWIYVDNPDKPKKKRKILTDQYSNKE